MNFGSVIESNLLHWETAFIDWPVLVVVHYRPGCKLVRREPVETRIELRKQAMALHNPGVRLLGALVGDHLL